MNESRISRLTGIPSRSLKLEEIEAFTGNTENLFYVKPSVGGMPLAFEEEFADRVTDENERRYGKVDAACLFPNRIELYVLDELRFNRLKALKLKEIALQRIKSALRYMSSDDVKININKGENGVKVFEEETKVLPVRLNYVYDPRNMPQHEKDNGYRTASGATYLFHFENDQHKAMRISAPGKPIKTHDLDIEMVTGVDSKDIDMNEERWYKLNHDMIPRAEVINYILQHARKPVEGLNLLLLLSKKQAKDVGYNYSVSNKLVEPKRE